MHVLELKAENFKRLRAVHITPPAGMVVVEGRNANGKSSVLDSIMYAIGGAAAAPQKPIHTGADFTEVSLDLGDLLVTRKQTATNNTLTVENGEGARYKSPQTMLDALFGRLTFDPLAFLRLAPKEQAAQLRAMVPLSVDVDALDGLNHRDYDDRTVVNREAAALRTQAQGIIVPQDAEEPRDLSKLLSRLEILGTRRNTAQEAIHAKHRAVEMLDQKRRDLDDLRLKVRDVEQDVTHLKAKLENTPDVEDPDELGEEISELQESIRNFQAENQRAMDAKHARESRDRLLKSAEEKEAQSVTLTAALDGREKQKRDALAAAKMPILGLSFGSEGVTYNGEPFSQASQAEKLRVSTAIAMAGSPKLKVILIRDGSALDSDGLAVMAQMAEEHGFQVWIERVSDGDGIGIVIEDGLVAGAVPPPPGPPLFPEMSPAPRRASSGRGRASQKSPECEADLHAAEVRVP